MTGVVNINYENANDYLTGNYHTVKYNKIALGPLTVSSLIDDDAYINLNTSALGLTTGEKFYVAINFNKILTSRKTTLTHNKTTTNIDNIRVPYLVYDKSISCFYCTAYNSSYQSIHINNLGQQIPYPDDTSNDKRYVYINSITVYSQSTFENKYKQYLWYPDESTGSSKYRNMLYIGYKSGTGNATEDIICSDNDSIQDRTMTLKIKTTDGTITRTITINQPFTGIGRLKIGTNFIIR